MENKTWGKWLLIENRIAKILLWVLMPVSVFTQGSWNWQNPIPQGADMFAVFTLSNSRVIITGNGGTIMTSTNSGQSFHIQRLPKVDWVRKYSFVSENEGLIIANWYDYKNNNKSISKIFKTNNGGIEWQELSETLNVDFSIYRIDDIAFISGECGYLLANPQSTNPDEQALYPGLIYKTDDKGIHWEKIDIQIPRKYHQVLFIDSLNGFLLSQPYYSIFDFEKSLLHKTVDGGKTWTTLNGEGYGRMHFINNRVGWAGNYKTIDGGNNWTYIQFNFPTLENPVNKIWFTDSLIGYAISYRTIFKTQDGGNSWFTQIETINGLLHDIQFYNSLIGYACGTGGIIYWTTNGGENWNRNGKGITEDLLDIDFINDEVGWVTGEKGVILHTDNGGEKWTEQNSETKDDLIGVDFIDNKNGWVIGKNTVLYTKDGGDHWLKKNEYQNIALTDVQFLDHRNGWIVGTNGTLLQTTNGGESWESKLIGVSTTLYDIHFVDSLYGWISGKNATLLATTNGGSDWRQQNIIGNYTFQKIQFIDRNNGWVSAGDEIAFFRTTDGGTTWNHVSLENYFFDGIHSFFFVNKNIGFANSFFFSDILTTIDGGLSWNIEERLSANRVHSLQFKSSNIGWGVGSAGAIMKYFNSDSLDTPSLENNTVGSYPNPFNRHTTVYFDLSYDQPVIITVFTVLGKKTRVLFQNFGWKGRNTIFWDSFNLCSGIYFVTIQSQEYIKTIKCMVLK